MKFGRYRIHVTVTSAGQSHTRLPKYQETSSCFSLCCFVIYVYIFVLGKTAGFVCHHFFKKGTTQWTSARFIARICGWGRGETHSQNVKFIGGKREWGGVISKKRGWIWGDGRLENILSFLKIATPLHLKWTTSHQIQR